MRNGWCNVVATCLIASYGCAAQTSSASSPLPTVDLGYAIHRPTINQTGQTYNFSNIRYAEPPLGNLRFAAPVSPKGMNRTVNDGQNYALCPQASPAWEALVPQVVLGANLSTLEAEQAASSKNFSLADIPKPGPGENEDCLFLDVVVPVSIFESVYSNQSTTRRKRRNNVSSGGKLNLGCVVGSRKL